MADHPALKLEDLSRSFRGRRVVNGLNLTVESGQIFGFLGPNGAGKTTVMNMIMGLLTPDTGRISLFGEEGGARSAAVRMRVGYLQEKPRVYPDMTARAYLEFFAAIHGVPAPRARAAAVLDLVGLTEAAGRRLGTFSRGMQQRACLARVMLHRPDLLILDEPTLGLDPTGIAEIRDVLRGMRAEGATLFFSSHQLAEMERICDQVAFLRDGRIVAAGPPADLVPAGSASGRIEVELHEPVGAALDAIRRLPAVAGAEPKGEHRVDVTLRDRPGETAGGRDARAALSRALTAAGLTVLSVRETTWTLEDLFLSLANEKPTKH